MTLIHHHRHSTSFEDAWPQVFYRAGIVCLAVLALAAFYFLFGSRSAGLETQSALPGFLPTLFPVIPLA